MPRVTHTCHTQELDTWHFLFLFSKNFKKIIKNLKKIKKNQKNHILTRDTLTNGVSQLCLNET